jgi:hypothetical protein
LFSDFFFFIFQRSAKGARRGRRKKEANNHHNIIKNSRGFGLPYRVLLAGGNGGGRSHPAVIYALCWLLCECAEMFSSFSLFLAGQERKKKNVAT